jgi:hypothetical protein
VGIALVHHPVVNRNGDIVASAVTNLDLHDIARAARTFGVWRLYVATPLDDQRALAEKIVSHWTKGPGGAHNPLRKEALALIRTSRTLAEAVDDMAAAFGRPPLTVATSARADRATMGFRALRRRLQAGEPVMLVFGTAWGMATEALRSCDERLSPISGRNRYNHLSVRSAAAIVLDRLLAPAGKRAPDKISSQQLID